jgi:hypothetical protein
VDSDKTRHHRADLETDLQISQDRFCSPNSGLFIVSTQGAHRGFHNDMLILTIAQQL